MASKERKRCVFSKDEILLIINLWREDKIQAKFRTTLKHNFIWDQLARSLNEFGYNKTSEEIKRKIQNLKHEYKTMKQLPGYDITTWTYYSAMHDVMERRIAEKGNINFEDDHDYAEQESDDQSGSRWMIMELKDISQTNSNNFQVAPDPIISIENTNDTEMQDEDVISNPSESKTTVSPQITARTLALQSAKLSSPTTKPTVKRIRKPFRYNGVSDRKASRTHGAENRVMERLTAMQERERRIDERERRINDRELRIEERERRIDDRERRNDERERRIEESERYFKEREKRFEERDKRHEERESRGSDAMCRFFDTCAQFLNQYQSPFSNTTDTNDTCVVQEQESY